MPKTKQSLQGSNTLKVTDWRKNIRTIESRYIEVKLINKLGIFGRKFQTL